MVDMVKDITELDCACMRRAVELARAGAGWTNPNPLVGAVIARDGVIIGEGFHERYGQAHAERNALADCASRGQSAVGATMYVTLEPCCHTGKQPPCTEAVVEAGIARVFVGSRDPNPLVAGKGRRARAAPSACRDHGGQGHDCAGRPVLDGPP